VPAVFTGYRAKVIPSFLSYFEDLKYCSGPGDGTRDHPLKIQTLYRGLS